MVSSSCPSTTKRKKVKILSLNNEKIIKEIDSDDEKLIKKLLNGFKKKENQIDISWSLIMNHS